jgi:putative selenate reductase
MFRELDTRGAIFDLALDRAFLGDPARDLSVAFHGHRPSSPFGPAAGPQSQLAQNIVLAWLGGARVVELKTVQVNDRIHVARPCIDMEAVGYNIEWSQELTLEESLEEYVKAALLIRMLVASGRLPLAPGFDHTVFDMSVGYDLAGITSPRVQAFLDGMRDCSPLVDSLRREVPREYRAFADAPVPARLADTLTLSTFHGCPPDEIERIVTHLVERIGVHCIVKLNPMLLGPRDTRDLLNDRLGYHDVRVPDDAFANDTTWPQMVEFVGRLGGRARALGLGFGVKFTNTLVVENHRRFFPESERRMYLSGPPLHVLAMTLVGRFRREFGDRYPISFSAGIDRGNFADAVALGLVPVTVCSDLLKTRGYARARGYFDALCERMARMGARTIDEFVVLGHGMAARALASMGLRADEERRGLDALASGIAASGAPTPSGGSSGAPDSDAASSSATAALADVYDEATWRRWVSAARLANTEAYVARVADDPRYLQGANSKPPRKIGRHLQLFDCITCDKCVPVCPNDANFTFPLPPLTIPIRKAWLEDGAWVVREEGALTIAEPHQIGNVADFCNDCGNCDVFCPEDGGPYIVKPRFFRTREGWEADRPRDGFTVCRVDDGAETWGRLDGRDYHVRVASGRAHFTGEGFEVAFDEARPETTLSGRAGPGVAVDLAVFDIINWLQRAVLDPTAVNFLACADAPASADTRASVDVPTDPPLLQAPPESPLP